MNRQFLIDFLKSLERVIPPPDKCHHAITYARYGSDADGWQDKLAVQINSSGTFKCFFVEPEDEAKSFDDLATEIGILHSELK